MHRDPLLQSPEVRTEVLMLPAQKRRAIMNSQRGVWSDLPLSTGIAALVCYAGVFGDVIGIDGANPGYDYSKYG